MIRLHTTAFTGQCSFSAFNNRPAGHGPVCTDENYVVTFSRPRKVTTRTCFCNYLSTEVEALEEKDFQTFRNEAVILLNGIQSMAKDRTSQSHELTISRTSSATSTYVPQTLQQPQQPAPTGREYNLTMAETQKASHPTSSAEPSGTRGQREIREQPTSL